MLSFLFFFFNSYSYTAVLVQKKHLQPADSSDFQLQEENIVRTLTGIFYDRSNWGLLWPQ